MATDKQWQKTVVHLYLYECSYVVSILACTAVVSDTSAIDCLERLVSDDVLCLEWDAHSLTRIQLMFVIVRHLRKSVQLTRESTHDDGSRVSIAIIRLCDSVCLSVCPHDKTKPLKLSYQTWHRYSPSRATKELGLGLADRVAGVS